MKRKSNVTSLLPRKSAQETDDHSVVSSLSPREIVSELDRYVIGQREAKKAIQVASEICVFTNNNITLEKI